MDPRFGRPVIRDRWGEPIEPEPPNPKQPKPDRRLRRLFDWGWHKFTDFARNKK